MDKKAVLSPFAADTSVPAAESSSGLGGTLYSLELAIQKAQEGLIRWQAGCFDKVSGAGLAGAEVTLLLLIGSGGRSKTIKELARATNRTDIPNIQYSLRKLASAGLTRKQGAGRSGVTYSLTDEGRAAEQAILANREALLLQRLGGHPVLAAQLETVSQAMEELAALYDEALRRTEAHSSA